MTGCTYNMRIYLGEDRQNVAQMTTIHVTVRSLSGRVQEVGHKLYMVSFFSSPDLFEISTVVGL
jgi:hypothetical protein